MSERIKLFEVVSIIATDSVRQDALFTQYKNAEKFALNNVSSLYPTQVRKIFIHKSSANYKHNLYLIVISRAKLFKNNNQEKKWTIKQKVPN